MPLSELYRMDRGALESNEQKSATSLTDLSHVADNEFAELVWENGQIMMQGQSSRARRNSDSSNVPSQTPKLRDKDLGNFTISKMGKFGVTGSVVNDFASAVPSVEMGLDQDDDMVPWLNDPFDDSLQQDYCSELLPEISVVSMNEFSAQNSLNKSQNCNQTIRGSHGDSVNNGLKLEQVSASKVSGSEVVQSSRSRNAHFYPWLFQENQTSNPSPTSGVPSIITNNISSTEHPVSGECTQAQASAGGFPSTKIQKHHSGLPSTSSGIMNFSHFSRPAALVRANLQNFGAMANTSGPAESKFSNLSCGLRREMDSHGQPDSVPHKLDSEPTVAPRLDESCIAEQSGAACPVEAVNSGKLPNQAHGEKTVEPIGASSSACSGNSAERASNNPTHNLKRKCRETDESEGRSDDVEEESVGVRKAAPARLGAGSKRGRAAEVHNLSERRRRDRINEKMRALQELIPNCNKVDKASMLDEAIEYLKTLQLQVQIMSMGAGMYMPPMMLPTGMQHAHATHMARFSPMGIGMGMGMGMGVGLGMGMMDMNGRSHGHGYPMIQVASMQGGHFPPPYPQPVMGPTFQGMAGPTLQIFGQGLPVSAPCAPSVPSTREIPRSLVGLNVSGLAAPSEAPNSAPSSSSKDLIQNTNSKMMHNFDASSSMNQTSNQATSKGFEQPSLVPKNDQAPEVGCSGDVYLTRENGIAPSDPIAVTETQC